MVGSDTPASPRARLSGIRETMADKTKAPVVGDARFQKVHNDPRFARLSTKKNKLQIDKRFAAVLKDNKFQAVQGKYDKYGRRIDKKENELKKFYRLDDESEDEDSDSSSGDEDAEASKKEGKAKAKSDSDSDDSEGEEEAEGDEKMSRLDFLNRMARGELESGSDTSDESDEDVELEDEQESEKEDIPLGDETKRFAVMNCDWTRIRAVDLFALFESFAPATGAVKDVTIYPSDFGLERMKEEEQHGPRALWADKQKNAEKDCDGDEDSSEKDDEDQDEDAMADEDSGSDGDENEDGEGYDSDDPLGVKKSVSAKEEEGFDVEKLRKYELQKLKYYYAVVTCDSVRTAAAIYENCDQLEYETSSNLLDLRFIPDDMEFKNQPKESCQSVPESYKPAIFATQALQRTDVKLTWEEDDESRVELLTRQSEWKNANDDDFAAFLASENSSSEDEDGDDENEVSDAEEQMAGDDKSRAERKKAAKLKKIKNRYRKMLLGSDAEDSEDDDDDANVSGSEEDKDGAESSDEGDSADEKPEGMSSDNEGDQEEGEGGNMELTFTPGAGDILKAKRQKELEANETPFERYVREKKQEKNKKRHEKRALQKQQAREQQDVLKKKGKMAPEQLKALRAAIDDDEDDDGDDEDGDRNFDMKKIARNEKVKKLKGKRKSKEMKKLEKKSGLQEGFEFDAADSRFSALYEKGSQFQLDPTDPKFKKTEATQAIFQERRKRQSEEKKKPQRTAANQAQAVDAGSKKDSKNELKAMVENLKRKAPPQAKKNAAPMKPFKKPKV